MPLTTSPRRHVSQGARAMAYALIYPESTSKGGRGKKRETVSSGNSLVTVSAEMISKARTVVREFGADLPQS